MSDACVGDADIKAGTKLLNRLSDSSLDLLGLSNIYQATNTVSDCRARRWRGLTCVDTNGMAAIGLDFFQDAVHLLFCGGYVGDGDIVAIAREAESNGTADSLTCTGDERDAVQGSLHWGGERHVWNGGGDECVCGSGGELGRAKNLVIRGHFGIPFEDLCDATGPRS